MERRDGTRVKTRLPSRETRVRWTLLRRRGASNLEETVCRRVVFDYPDSVPEPVGLRPPTREVLRSSQRRVFGSSLVCGRGETVPDSSRYGGLSRTPSLPLLDVCTGSIHAPVVVTTRPPETILRYPSRE